MTSSEYKSLVEKHAYDSWAFRCEETLVPEDLPWSEPQQGLTFNVTTQIAHVPGEQVTLRNRHVLDSKRRVIYETGVPFDELGIPFERLEKPQSLDGIVAYLSNSWSDNYAHFMTLVVPHLRYYRQLPVEPDYYYIGAPIKGWQLDILELFGISSDQVISNPVRPTSALVPLVIANEPHALPDAQRFMQASLPCQFAQDRTRRIFVGRGPTTTRRMVDEAEHARRLVDEFGFEYVASTAELSIPERAELFGSAACVVMPHGAAQANLLFSPPGTKVLELRTGSLSGLPLTGFQSICWALEHHLGRLSGEPLDDSTRTGLAQDIVLEPDRLRSAVATMLDWS